MILSMKNTESFPFEAMTFKPTALFLEFTELPSINNLLLKSILAKYHLVQSFYTNKQKWFQNKFWNLTPLRIITCVILARKK